MLYWQPDIWKRQPLILTSIFMSVTIESRRSRLFVAHHQFVQVAYQPPALGTISNSQERTSVTSSESVANCTHICLSLESKKEGPKQKIAPHVYERGPWIGGVGQTGVSVPRPLRDGFAIAVCYAKRDVREEGVLFSRGIRHMKHGIVECSSAVHERVWLINLTSIPSVNRL